MNVLADAEISIEEVCLPHAPFGSIDIVTLGDRVLRCFFFFAVSAKIYSVALVPHNATWINFISVADFSP